MFLSNNLTLMKMFLNQTDFLPSVPKFSGNLFMGGGKPENFTMQEIYEIFFILFVKIILHIFTSKYHHELHIKMKVIIIEIESLFY